MSYLDTSRGMFTKEETTAGTSSDPLDRDNSYANPEKQDVRIRELSVSIENQKDDESSKYLTGDFTGDEAIPGISSGTLDYTIKVAPAESYEDPQSAGTYIHKLNYDKYLKNSSLREVVFYDTGGAASLGAYEYLAQRVYYPTIERTEATYTNTVVDKGSVTQDGIAYEFTGCMSNFTLSAESVGAPFMLEMSTQGAVGSVFSVPAVDMPNLAFDDTNVMKTVADTFLNTTIEITDIEAIAA